MLKTFLNLKLILIIVILIILAVLAEFGIVFSITQGGPFTIRTIYAFGSQFSVLLMCLVISKLVFYEIDMEIDEIVFSNCISKIKSNLFKLCFTMIFSLLVGIIIVFPVYLLNVEIDYVDVNAIYTVCNYISLGITIFAIANTIKVFNKRSVVAFLVNFMILYVIHYNTSYKDIVSSFNILRIMYVNTAFGAVSLNTTIILLVFSIALMLTSFIVTNINDRRI